MGGHQPNRSASVNDDGLAWFYASQFGGVPPRGENIGQHDVVILFFLRIVREFEAVEVGVGNAKIFGLATAVRSHPGEAVGRAGRSGIGSKTKSSQPRLAIFTKAAGNIESRLRISTGSARLRSSLSPGSQRRSAFPYMSWSFSPLKRNP